MLNCLLAARKAVEMIRWTVLPEEGSDAEKAIAEAEKAMLAVFAELNLRELRETAFAGFMLRSPVWPETKDASFVYLGGVTSDYYDVGLQKRDFDLYLVNGAHHQTLLARYGAETGDYVSMPAAAVHESLTREKLSDVIQGPLLTVYLTASIKDLLT